MDTRRRADSRESSRPSAPDEPRAELVEFGPVPQPNRRGVTPMALGVTLFAAGVLAGSSLVRLAPGDVATSTNVPAPSGTNDTPSGGPSASPVATRATPRPTFSTHPTPRPTVQPTPAPTDVPWAWTGGTFVNVDQGGPNGLWSVGGTLVVAVDNAVGTSFRTSVNGTDWITNDSPRAIAGYPGSTIVGDRLWFVLRISGLQSDHYEIGYPTWTEDGANVTWSTVGQAIGDVPDWVGGFARIGKTWVMAAGHRIGEGGLMDTKISDDGIHWTTIQPTGESLAIQYAQRLGSKLVALAQRQSTDNAWVALTTEDGRRWQSAAFPPAGGDGPVVYRMACGAAACMAVGSTAGVNPERPAMWRTTDGLHWVSVGADVVDARRDGYLAPIVATSQGFVVLGSPDREALISRDGWTWTSVAVLSRNDPGDVEQLAVSGDLIYGLGPDSIGGSRQWIGSVADLPFK